MLNVYFKIFLTAVFGILLYIHLLVGTNKDIYFLNYRVVKESHCIIILSTAWCHLCLVEKGVKSIHKGNRLFAKLKIKE